MDVFHRRILVDSNCLFCKIIAGLIPSAKVFEDENVYAFLDLYPIEKGHTLVIPKLHYETFFDLPNALIAPLFSAAKVIALAQQKTLGASGFNLLQNNGVDAGQEIHHFHLHIIPRFENKNQINWKSKGPADSKEIFNLAEKIKVEL